MFDSLKEFFQDPLILGAVLSGTALIVVLLLLLFLRRLILSVKVDESRQVILRRIATHGSFVLYGLVLIRIWAYTYLRELLDASIVARIFPSLIGLILVFVTIYVARRILDALKIEEEKRQLYRKWTGTIVVFLYAFVLIRIWAIANLFEIFRNPFVVKVYKSLLILGFVSLGLFFIRRFINSLKVDIAKRHQYRKRATYIATFVYILILIPLWAGSTQQWATILSVMGAGIALALHEVLLNMAGWVYISIRRPYREGDRIELGDIRGDVIDIQLFQTTLLEIGNWVDGDQSTGRVIHLPHGQIFRNPLYNYTKGFEFIWDEISIIVTFESDWEKAKEILVQFGEEESKEIQERVQRKIARMAREYLIYYRTYTPIVYTKIEDSGIKLTLRYLTEAKKRRAGIDVISQKILQAVHAAEGVEFAYPTYRIYRQGEEGPSK